MERSGNRFFYGWVIVGVALVALVVSNGLSIYGIPVFYRSIREEFVASGAIAAGQAESFIAFGATLTFLCSGLISPLAGWLIARYRLKRLMLAGCVMLGAGLTLHAVTTSPLAVYAARVLMGSSLGFIGVLPSVVLVSNWFERRRGTALGILLAGTSIGGIVIPPIATPLVAAYGWRTAMLLVSLLIWVVLVPAIVLLVRDRPGDVGLEPDGELRRAPSAGDPSAATGMTFGEALRTPQFWIFAMGAALIFYPIFVSTQQFILQAGRIGVDPPTASLMLSSIAAASIVGKSLFGALSDRFDPLRVILVCSAVMLASTFFLLELTLATAFAFLIVFGLGYGGALVLIQRLTADFFGRRDYPKILGAITIGDTLGAALGGLVTGRLADASGGDYTTAFFGVIAAAAGAFVLMLVLNVTARRTKVQFG
ncbi:MAG: MFS transporter [Pyrinomonadaceae bacterium]